MLSFGNITAHGQVYLYPEKPPASLWWVDPKGHTNYWCSVQGESSGSSSSPRTESRETLPDSAESYNWVAGEAVHIMKGTVRVELAPSSGKVIIGQIHAWKGPNPFVMVTWWNGVARVDVRNRPTDNAMRALSVPCKLGESFSYSLTMGFDGVLQITLNGLQYALNVSNDWAQYPFYFKAGAYVIDKEGPESEGGWVVYENFEVSHDV